MSCQVTPSPARAVGSSKAPSQAQRNADSSSSTAGCRYQQSGTVSSRPYRSTSQSTQPASAAHSCLASSQRLAVADQQTRIGPRRNHAIVEVPETLQHRHVGHLLSEPRKHALELLAAVTRRFDREWTYRAEGCRLAWFPGPA
jgi:hypothetical protein